MGKRRKKEKKGKEKRKMIKKKKIPISIVLTAIGCLTLLELMAIWKGIDGKLFALIVGMIAGLAGWIVPSPKI